jgi:hypothetical protein
MVPQALPVPLALLEQPVLRARKVLQVQMD